MLQGQPIPGRVKPTARAVYRAQIGPRVSWPQPSQWTLPQPDMPGTIVCPRCHAISLQKRWFLDEGRYQLLRDRPTTRLVVCPGCRRIERHEYQGEVTLESPLLARNKVQALHLIYHEEAKARQDNPISRLAAVQDHGDRIEVSTTTRFLAEQIGRAFHKSFKGSLAVQRLPEEEFVRVRWCRM